MKNKPTPPETPPETPATSPDDVPAPANVRKLREVGATLSDTTWGNVMREVVAEATPESFPDSESAAMSDLSAADILARIEKHAPRRSEAGHMLPATMGLCVALIGGGAVVCTFLHNLGLM